MTETPGPSKADPRAGAAPLADVHVVLVDGDPASRGILQAVLEYGGALVSATATARDALGVLGRVRADVILTEATRPGEDGYRLVQHLRAWPAARGGRVPVIAMSAGRDEREALLGAGFAEHLRTPIAAGVLYRVIGRLIGGLPAAGRRAPAPATGP